MTRWKIKSELFFSFYRPGKPQVQPVMVKDKKGKLHAGNMHYYKRIGMTED